ncbi:MAG: right-handed parallel beta-helix repeat-containing protein [Myxococcota bacterium]
MSNFLQYVIIDGLVLDGINVADVAVNIQGGPNHIRIQNCEIKNAYGNGISIFYRSTTGISSDYNEILNCDVHHNGRRGGTCTRDDCRDENGNPISNGADYPDTAPGYGRAHAFYVNTSYNLFEGNRIHHNGQYGIHIYDSKHLEHPFHGNVVRNNIIYDNSLNSTRYGQPSGAGIILSGGTGHMAYNNVIWGNVGGIDVSYDAIDALVVHNTVYDNDRGISVGDPWSLTKNTYVANNLLIGNGGGITVSGNVQNTTVEGNFLYQSGSVVDQGASSQVRNNTLNVDPQVFNAAAHDFRPKDANSPLVDRGVAVTTKGVGFDHNGDLRPQGQGPDIGAFEFGGAGAPPPPPPPSPVETEPKFATGSQVESAVVVDGNLDDCGWAQADWQSFQNARFSDNTAGFAVLWDATHLYLGFDVIDGSLETDASEAYLNDGIEIFIDASHDGGAAFDPADDWHGIVDISGRSSDPAINVSHRPSSTGYTLEVSIPWTLFGVKPAAGQVIGLLVGNNDRDAAEGHQFDWANLINSGDYRRPNLWGDLTLDSIVSCTPKDPGEDTLPTTVGKDQGNDAEDCIPIDVRSGDVPDSSSTTVTIGEGAKNGAIVSAATLTR